MTEYQRLLRKLGDKDRKVLEHYLEYGRRNAAFYSFYSKKEPKYKVTKLFNSTTFRSLIKMHKEKVDEVAVKVLEQQGYDKAWVQARLARIADFQINRFIKMIGGRPHYDFSKATEEDWYCISEYTADAVIRDSDIDVYPCEKIKIKSNCKMKALELMGKTVGAFTDKVEHSGGVTIHFEDDFENDD